jgi:hypothetical protein
VAQATRESCAPWCIKTHPDMHISHVEDELEQGISAYSVKLRLLRLERISRYVELAKDREGYPVVLEVVLLHEEIAIYQDPAKKEKLRKLFEEALSQGVKLKLKAPKAEERAVAKGPAKAGKADDGMVLRAGQCEVVDALEVKEASVDGVWLLVRYGTESTRHAAAFVAELAAPGVLSALEGGIQSKLSNTQEERLRRASFPKSGPVLVRMNRMTPGVCSQESVQNELVMLRALLAGSQSAVELFRWKGLTLRYKGQQPWAQRQAQDQGRPVPYFYLDHDSERVLYASSGVTYVEDEMDFKEAVQNVAHREAFAATATGAMVLYLTSVPSYSLVVRAAHPDLALDSSLLSRGVKVAISTGAPFSTWWSLIAADSCSAPSAPPSAARAAKP